jgi:hypothetical protein
MTVTISSRLSIGWDEPYPDGIGAEGTVVDWVPRVDSDALSAIVQLDAPVTAEGQEVVGNSGTGAQSPGTGDFVPLSTRYVGQTWDTDRGTVHVELAGSDPRLDSPPRRWWVTAHGVYRVLEN